jgi:hypothetical protein
MGYINLPPTIFDTVKALETRLAKLEQFNQLNKVFTSYAGSVSITPVASTPTSATITLNPSPFTQSPLVYTTVNNANIGAIVVGSSTSGSSTTGNSRNGYQTTFNVWVYRTNTAATVINYMAVQMTPASASS